MAREHAPHGETPEHSPFLLTGGGGGGAPTGPAGGQLAGEYPNPTLAAGTIHKASLSEEVNELLGKGGPPSGPAGGVLAGTYPNPSLAAEGVTTAAVKLLAIVETLLGEESVSAIKIKAEAVTTAKIALLAITTALLAGEAVTTAKIKLLAITEALLGEESVSAIKIKGEAVTTAKIKLLAITAALLGEESVETAKIKNEAVTLGKLAKAVQEKLEAAFAPAAVYGASTERAVNTEFEVSATEAALVTLSIAPTVAAPNSILVEVGGVVVFRLENAKGTSEKFTLACSFIVPAGKKWKVTSTEVFKIKSTYLTL